MCTAWHTCLVFETEHGVRLPLCEACLPFVVERAAAQSAPAPRHVLAGARAGRR